MAEKLTPQQQQAVDDRGGKLLVSAAAGSGKTKVLVDRLLKYISDPAEPANVDDFLLITYTKAAASELRGKIAAKLSERIAEDPTNRHLQRQLQRLYLTKISTVHAFCADILREYAYRLDISGDFRVADETESMLLRTRAMEQVLEAAYASIGEDTDLQAFVDTQGLGRTDSRVPEIIETVYDSARCHLDPQTWLDGCVAHTQTDGVTDAAQTLYGRYLMDDLFTCLDLHVGAMGRCADLVDAADGMGKPAQLLRDTVNQLLHLRASTTWDEIVARKNIDYGRLTFPKKADDPSVSEPVKAVRSACKTALEKKLRSFADTSAQILEDLNCSAAAARGLIKLVDRFGDTYDRMKRSRRVLDFGDLEHKTLDLLLGKRRSGATAIAREIGERFREILVDEYQDSNAVQDAIFSALTERRQNLFMVGDVKQSIYQFRLADPTIFLEKYSTYVPARDARNGQGRKVLLSSNFRSGGGVISAVNDVFRECMSEQVGGLTYGQEEALREGIPHIALPDAEVELHCIDVQEDTYAEEAAFVADRIEQLLDGRHYVRQADTLRPITEDDIVILLRSPGSVSPEFQYALESRGIRCASGSGMDLLLTQEIGTLRALLQTISNPRQDIPLVAALASPVFGFTADDLAALRGNQRQGSLFEALCAWKQPKAVQFLEILSVLRRSAFMNTLPELLERIFNLTRLDTLYASMPGGETRLENLRSFYQLAADFCSSGFGGLDQFLVHLDSLEKKGLLTAGDAATGGCVTIMSIHKSKGLEFPVVFLCGLSRRFNRESLLAPVLCEQSLGLGLSCVDSANRVRYSAVSKRAIAAKLASDGLSEELRVLYVAMTRARDRLIMTYASDSLQKDVQDLALRMDLSGRALMTGDVSCPGKWVLYSAVRRTEAGALFALGGRPAQTASGDTAWKITVQAVQLQDADIPEPVAREESCTDDPTLDAWKEALSFRYAHTAATVTPSKQTATQRKGRVKDQEAAELADAPRQPVTAWRRPTFLTSRQQGKDFGSATHSVLQYICYEACTDVAAVEKEIARLVDQRYITPEQGKLASSEKIARFFATDVGKRLRTGKQVLREFKFSVLEDATEFGADLEDEKVLLQGVVDCALVEEDGITVIDFKTDFVTEQTLPAVTARYVPQVQTYADALSRIFQLPVKAKALYFFHMDRFCWL
ncbi:MAG: helicase-exonuclease AddAB subunit AddA [Oscillospiraceae bacterium]|nr:helicase-exonuclease AddAB subunit AddA [Oscillospiraceae bacterium]